MYLVPAEHYLHVDLDRRIGNTYRVEIFTNTRNSVTGYVVESYAGDSAGKPLSLQRKVLSTIPNLTHDNWGMPWEAGSVLVIVGDREDENTKTLNSSFRLDMAAKARTEAYTYVT
jgi:hypothetical protein